MELLGSVTKYYYDYIWSKPNIGFRLLENMYMLKLSSSNLYMNQILNGLKMPETRDFVIKKVQSPGNGA